jgi:hypothetical protein
VVPQHLRKTEMSPRFKSYSADKPFVPPGDLHTRVYLNYILHRKERRIEPVDCRPREGLFRWADWFENNPGERTIGNTSIGGCMVSTVFLGLDHSFCRGAAVLFETMVFPDHDDGGMSENYQERYHTLAEAEQGYIAVVELVKQQAFDAEQTAASIIARLRECR